MLELEWQRKIKLLTATVWDRKIDGHSIERWLNNFKGAIDCVGKERMHAYHLLQQFMYFGHREIKELLKALYRDHFVYPTVRRLKTQLPTATSDQLQTLFQEELRCTRFLGVGTPAESGTHLLYYFRQENQLPKDVFTTVERVFRFSRKARPQVRDASIRTFVYMDDFCGSGQQVTSYLSGVVDDLRSQLPGVRVVYLMLFATSKGLSTVKDAAVFDDVSAVVELDEHYRAFSQQSIYFRNAKEVGIEKEFSKKLMSHYGQQLTNGFPFGYGDCQLLLGLFHNTPDNTLPVFWAEDACLPWHPIFPRYHKLYDW